MDHLDWLDGNTRSAIRKKVGRTSELFGYPDFIFNSSELDRVYADLYVTEDEYLENQVLFDGIQIIITNQIDTVRAFPHTT